MNQSRFLYILFGLLVLAIVGRVWFGYRSQPQLPPNAEVYKTVDALFTAVTAQSEPHLKACEARLASYKQRGLLPKAASQRLEQVIATARAGEWRSAAERLYDFMQGQRREGTPSSPPVGQTAMQR